MKIELGQKVKCIVTGLEGITTCRGDYLSGVSRWEVQPPKDKDGNVPETFMVDAPQLVVVDKKRIVICEELKEIVKMGQKVRDPISDIEGIVVGQALYLNGCRRILIGLKKDKDGKLQKSIWIDEPQLEVVAEKIEVKRKSSNTGGPCPMKPNRDY